MLIRLYILIMILIACMILLCFSFKTQIDLHKEIIELKLEKEELRLKNNKLRNSLNCNKLFKTVVTQPVCSQETIEAVHYAMIKSHPDNGGKQEDFVKFRDLYRRLRND